jgi:hypothetical protein
MLGGISPKGAAAVLVALCAIAIGTRTVSADHRTGMIVHEWGTFSSFSGSNGALLSFHPDNTDLPKFVHRGKIYTKDDFSGTVSLETPVVYFYSDKPITATVRAEFPSGVFTEWFPQAERSNSLNAITWPEVNVCPGEPVRLPGTPNENHYYAARETDATPIEVTANKEGTQLERERFLFYRGVGVTLKTPLKITAQGNGSFSVQSTQGDSIPFALLLEVKAGAIRFGQLPPLAGSGSATVSLPAERSNADTVRSKLIDMLTKVGLFEKEAKAMVKTWEKAWLGDDGTRVLYILPAAWTDRALPLRITPKPDALVRVMVGRHDVLTPEREHEIDSVVQQLKNLPESERTKATSAALSKLGRFAAPARQQAEARLALRR